VFTFDKDYYSSKYYDIIKLLDRMVMKQKEIPIIFKKLIENEYKDYLEDVDDIEKLEKLEKIIYI
jgi:hypothetical protein